MTFGLSQQIYNLQAFKFRDECIKSIERIIFRFLVSSKRDNDKVVDRIKSPLSKNYIAEEGLNITDIEYPNKSFKLRQFVELIDQNVR
jgi:hypothetical protein